MCIIDLGTMKVIQCSVMISLLLACLMGQYCFARWRLLSVVCRRRLSESVTLVRVKHSVRFVC